MIKEKKREINDEVTETNDSFFSSTQIEVPKKINIDCFSPILSTPTGNDVKKVKKESKTKEKGGGGEGGIKNKMECEKMKLIEKFLECGEKNSKEESKGGDEKREGEKGAEEYKKKEKRFKKKMKGKESKEDEEKSLLHSKLLQDALDSLNSSRDDPVGGSANEKNETNAQKSTINDNDNDMKCSNEFLIGDDVIDNVNNNNNNSSKANDDKCKNKIKKDKDKKKKKKEKKEKKNRSKSKSRKNTSKEFLCTELLKNALNYLNSISEDSDDVVKEEEEKGDEGNEKMGTKENDNRESEGFINSSDNSSDVFVKEKIINKKRRKKEKKKC